MKKSDRDWDLFYLRLARQYATGSKDPSTKVGALLVDKDHRLRSAGYNNFNRESDDNDDDYLDRDKKLKFIKHAEIGCIDDFKEDTRELTIYVYPFMPCIDCARAIIKDHRISKLVTTDYVPSRWKKSFEQTKKEFERSKFKMEQYRITEV